MSGTVAIVGAGQIGYAVARAFAASGWQVSVYARTSPAWTIKGAKYCEWQRPAAPASAADCLVDTIAYDAPDIDAYDPARIGRLILVSSASVYSDGRGRTLDEAAVNGFPSFPEPITEDQQTVEPGDATYSTRKVRLELRANDRFKKSATILRPCAIHGPWSRHPREWWFVKRMLDGRREIPLLFRGQSQFQTTSTETIGRFAHFAAEREIGGFHNLSDADAPTVGEIGKAIADRMGCSVDWVGIPSEQSLGLVGRTPWSIPAPMIVRGSAQQTWSQPYAQASSAAVDWLAALDSQDWETRFSGLAAYPWPQFDYPAEDRFLKEAALAATGKPIHH